MYQTPAAVSYRVGTVGMPATVRPVRGSTAPSTDPPKKADPPFEKWKFRAMLDVAIRLQGSPHTTSHARGPTAGPMSQLLVVMATVLSSRNHDQRVGGGARWGRVNSVCCCVAVCTGPVVLVRSHSNPPSTRE